MNPFDLPGPEFLLLYFACLAIATALTISLRYLLRSPGGTPSPASRPDVYQIALLHGGLKHAAETAIASLLHRRAISLNSTTRTLSLAGPHPRNLHPAEDAVYLTLSSTTSAAARADYLRTVVAAELKPLADGLILRDLIPTPARAALAQWGGAIPLYLCAAMGVIKWCLGVTRHRPVGFLSILLAFTALVIVHFVTRPIHTTRRGGAYLAALRRQSAALRAAVSRPSDMVSPTDVAAAIALFGLPAVPHTQLANLAHALRPPKQSSYSSGDSWSTSSCSTSSCSSSSCGGGCGGGSCGGCGS